ncbi:crustacean hyperglycemic hormone-like [Centruroides sculpturatus]|uniref:crustacean hyperglycemic hormone-like n=1 Tax=Centruroides sculpturatus TaxID=218467 RepID=UPI000C6DEB75|nr:crustacean hyperglycemic hormone-like [Centruroides sculpturatus]XP_023221292.1 crustacean hyperglycemic hormone-like [Centruroides sculpturatus]
MVRFTMFLVFSFCLITIQGMQIKRQTNYITLGCMGKNDPVKFDAVSRVCEDCFELYRQPEIIRGCKSNCFKNSYFNKCVEALLRSDELDELLEMVEELHS